MQGDAGHHRSREGVVPNVHGATIRNQSHQLASLEVCCGNQAPQASVPHFVDLHILDLHAHSGSITNEDPSSLPLIGMIAFHNSYGDKGSLTQPMPLMCHAVYGACEGPWHARLDNTIARDIHVSLLRLQAAPRGHTVAPFCFNHSRRLESSGECS